ncbi:hypothetical protein [Humibacter ginsenosidimutans]|uniref:Uncharacterized protein n=1 Tax=Humibacter ginsenosidimutans TaxID=2599293 RepID=A0A5B8M586_9MICO|nr:hypothetical protein [Humibacter ginsenosidimutans]QDZ15351.1 hypothetical protein FPZ11_11765 [Humibacter ginsenosidimutans]
MSEPARRVHVEQLLPRNQYLVTPAVAASALRERRWVDGELGLTEEWLVFASGNPHDAPDFVLLDGDVEVEVTEGAGTAIVSVTVSRTAHRYRADVLEVAPLVDTLRRLRAEPPSGTRVWRADADESAP